MTEKDKGFLLTRAKELSTSPGVYFMKDPEGKILYIGKAKNLKNRVTSYFKVGVHEATRIELLVSRIDHFDVILTETESEALILESTLIKKHKPKFNVQLKDDKSYPYIKVPLSDSYPRLQWTRKVVKDGSRYFGPFPSARSVKQVVQLLNETFQLRDCSDNTFSHRSRPCILFEMSRCTGPCVGKIPAEDYQATIREVVEILSGKASNLLDSLRRKMNEASELLDYEKAALIRDQIKDIEVIIETQTVQEAGGRNRDVVAFAIKEGIAVGTLLQLRNGLLISVKHYFLENLDGLSEAEILYGFLAQHYSRDQDTHPAEVLVPGAPDDVELLEKTFSITLKVSENEKDQQILNVALANAQHSIEVKAEQRKGPGLEALEGAQKKLHLEKLPTRIECYDISNIQGEDAVASRVVFSDGYPDKSLYRRYKIRTVEGANDFAMMKEVLERRFSRGEEPLPDLIIVDGGKGQLSQAIAILDELNIQGVSLSALAKAKTESDYKKQDVQSSPERVFLPNRKNPVILTPGTKTFQLFTHIRDEAHRFAISYHRQLRAKRVIKGSS